MGIIEFATSIPDANAQDAIFKADVQVRRHHKIGVAISGGSDSAIMTDMVWMLDKDKKAIYYWMDTGLEYYATKRHLAELENKYGIEIVKLSAKKSIPTCCKEYGVPFLSKRVSHLISRLQAHGFDWKDGAIADLEKKFPNCRLALRWWCNDFGEKSRFNIDCNRWLKEFLIENPPDFAISDQCCNFAKKSVAKEFIRDSDIDLNCVGVRRSEGGVRATAYKSCYTPSDGGGVDQFRPIFWLNNHSKQVYKEARGITYSDCYEVWGLERTGCAVCPFGKNFEFELECVKRYEPKFYLAVQAIFGKSYEYTRKYREFQKKMKNSTITWEEVMPND